MTPEDARAFLRANTQRTAAPLVPEVPLWLATEITPLWEATEVWLAQRGVEPPFWAFAWPGSQVLARHILDAPEVVRGRTVLDFACGCGLAGIAAARAGAARVIAVDLDPMAIEATLLNAATSGVTVEPVLADLTGGPLPDDVDVVLAGDVCYERGPSARILAWLRAAARRARVLVADPGRSFAPTDGLHVLGAWDVPTTVEVEGVVVRRTRLLALDP